ncbi:MAG: hypothetical protein ABL949_09965 [Fimbriimonadaceae bacterium]
MKLPLAIGLACLVTGARASDHNNLDSGRPLRFDDAYSIAFGERTFDFGLNLDSFRRKASTYGFDAEFKYGFAKNQDIGIGMAQAISGETGKVELSYFHGVRREIENAPALAYRVDFGLPTREGEEVDLRLRGIATKALGQYDRVHLNLDLGVEPRSAPRYGLILGYSTPLGYPKRFDQTLVAEFTLEQIEGNTHGSLGLGLRQQVGVRSVFDFGVQTGLIGPDRTTRLTVGYSVGF